MPKHFNGKNIVEGVFNIQTHVNPVRGVELEEASKMTHRKTFDDTLSEYERNGGFISRPVPSAGGTYDRAGARTGTLQTRTPSPDRGSAGGMVRENLSDVDLASSGTRGGRSAMSQASSNNLMDQDLEHDMNDEEPEKGSLLYSFDDHDDEEIE